MPELKRIKKESIPSALMKAERYRLLNEPEEAESICRDVLAVDPDNQQATVNLLLSLTDQFPGMRVKIDDVRPIVPQLTSDYHRQYYAGVMLERWAKALLGAGYDGGTAYELFAEAMACYESAEKLSAADNDDAVLRWNTCAREIEQRGLAPSTASKQVDTAIDTFFDEVPNR
jgi:hypothetical protein